MSSKRSHGVECLSWKASDFDGSTDNMSTITVISTTSINDINQNLNHALSNGVHSNTATKSLSSADEKFSKKSPKPKWHRYLGILLTILANMTMSLMTLTAKVLEDFHPFTLSFWRYCGNIFPTIPVILYLYFYKREPIFKEITSFWGEKNKENRTSVLGILVRGLIGGGTTISKFAAQTYLGFADTSVITQSTPAIVFIFAFFCLHEKCSVVAIISATLAIIGLLVLSRPPLLTGQNEFNSDSLIGVGLAILALFCSATSIILTRKLRKVNFAILIFGYGIGGLFVSSVLSCSFGVFRRPTELFDILVIMALILLTFVGQAFTILALKYEEAGTVSIISLSYVLFSFLWQGVFLRQLPDSISILGSLIVVTGILLTSLRKWVQGMPEESSTRRTLSFLLK